MPGDVYRTSERRSYEPPACAVCGSASHVVVASWDEVSEAGAEIKLWTPNLICRNPACRWNSNRLDGLGPQSPWRA